MRPIFWFAVVVLVAIGFRVMSSTEDKTGGELEEIWDVSRSLAAGHGFVRGDGSPSDHYPPLLMIVLVPFSSFDQARVVVAALCLLHVTIGFIATQNMYGTRWATIVGLVLAMNPLMIDQDTVPLSESIIAALFIMVIWSLAKDRVRLAGIMAGLLFLAKASLGPFILVALASGLIWRFATRGIGKTLTDKSYLTAGVLFACFVVPWTLRNWFVIGHLETQPYATASLIAYVSSGSVMLLINTFNVFVWAILLGIIPFIIMVIVWRPQWRANDRGLFMMSFVLVFVSAILMATSFRYVEGQGAWDTSIRRYIIPSLVPFMWTALELRPLASRGR
jgi:hypothetical protein